MARVKQAIFVLNWLKTKGELTTREAETELDIMCLPKRIEDLRKDGYAIKTEYRTSRTGKRYGVYSLIGGGE